VAALDLDSGLIEAVLLATWMPDNARLGLVRGAVVAHPDDGRAFELLGALAKESDEREHAYRRALELRPADVGVMDQLAWLLMGQRKMAEAQPIVEKALKRAPYDFNVNDTYAELELHLGHCGSALQYERQAVDLASTAPAEAQDRLAARLSELRRACSGDSQFVSKGRVDRDK